MSDTRVVISASDQTKAAVDSALRNFETIKGSAASLSAVFATATAALASLTVVAKFQDFVAGAAALDDLAEKTGASVEKLSALASVARISGTNIETVEGGLIKFAKAINSVDSETSKAGQAFAALGLDPQKLRTQDTAEAFKVLADTLSKFKDDSSKTAAVLEILGKSGAQLLPYLKDLADTGDLQARVTSEQAAQAENLEKNLNRLFATKNAGFKEFSAAVLPTVDSFVKALLDAANASDGLRSKIRELAADGTIREWAQNVAIGFATVVDIALGAKTAVETLGKTLAIMALQAEYGFGRIQRFFDTRTPPKIKEIQEQTARANLDAVLGAAQQDLDALLNRTQFRDKVRQQFAQGAAPENAPARPSLNFQQAGQQTAEKFKDELRIIDLFVAQLGQRLTGQTEGEFAMLRQRAQDVFGQVDLSKLRTDQAERFFDQMVRALEIIDDLEERSINAAWAKALADSFKLAEDAADKANDALRSFNETQSRQAQDLEFELGLVGKLSAERQKLAAIRRIELDAQRQIAAVPENAANREETIANITALAESAKENTGNLLDNIRSKSRDTFVGLSSAAEEYFDRVTNGAENVRTLFNRAFSSMEDALVKFTMTGKLEFKDLVSSIVADIARIQIRQSVTAPLAGALGGLFGGSASGGGDVEALGAAGGSGGGFFDSIFNFLGFRANGGPVMPGGSYIVGERGPELFVPSAAGTIVPNGGGMTFAPQYVYNIDSRSDQASIAAMLRESEERTKRDILQSRARGGAFA